MKKGLCMGVLCFLMAAAYSQTTRHQKQQKASKHVRIANTKKPAKTESRADTLTLTSMGNYPAKVNLNSSLNANRYMVSDPILTALNARANGANIMVNKSGIVGMPKRAYGFANGHLLLTTTGATTSGTQTGSGAVGTGSSLGTFGSNGAAMQVNGKSPYAGINMWGNAFNLTPFKIDSSERSTPMKKQ